mgnify:CR=1 FL=1
MLFIEYPKCSTCQKAKCWLDENGVAYTDRHILEQPPTYEELKEWHARSGLPLRRGDLVDLAQALDQASEQCVAHALQQLGLLRRLCSGGCRAGCTIRVHP